MREDALLASMTVPGRSEAVRPAASLLVSMARQLKVPGAEQSLFEVALIEALSNALEQNAGDEAASLRCDLELVGHTLTIRVLDEGVGAPVAFHGLRMVREVFREITAVTRDGRHGIELTLTF